jgi:hypothetical protein
MEDLNIKSNLTLTITPYEWEGNEEFTYEVRGWNIYHSKVGFKTIKEAEIEGKLKLKELKLKKLP